MIAIGSPDLTFRSVTFVATFISSHGANAPKCNASLFPPSIPPGLAHSVRCLAGSPHTSHGMLLRENHPFLRNTYLPVRMSS